MQIKCTQYILCRTSLCIYKLKEEPLVFFYTEFSILVFDNEKLVVV